MAPALNRVDQDINFSIRGIKFLMQLNTFCPCETWVLKCISSEDQTEEVAEIVSSLFSALFLSEPKQLKNAKYDLFRDQYSILFPHKDNIVKEIHARWDTARLGSQVEQWDGEIETLKTGHEIIELLDKIKFCGASERLDISSFTRSDGRVIV